MAELLSRPAWHREAACRGRVEAMFPERGEPVGPGLALCHQCPVVAACAEAGASEKFGIWGGSTVRARTHRLVAVVAAVPSAVMTPTVESVSSNGAAPAESAQDDPGLPVPVPTAQSAATHDPDSDAGRLCVGPGCTEPLREGAPRHQLYCSALCRNRARDARVDARQAARERAVEVGPETRASASPPATSLGPTPDGLVDLVAALVGRGVDVELERAGWRLTVHPRT